ncbi:hypothetical protein GCM10027612_67640 [Microbispora bryophytorum subsp. camponoti]
MDNHRQEHLDPYAEKSGQSPRYSHRIAFIPFTAARTATRGMPAFPTTATHKAAEDGGDRRVGQPDDPPTERIVMSHSPQRLGVVAESAPGETRVAATPATVPQLVSLGYEVIVESGAGSRSGFTDDAYARTGARIAGRAETWDTDVVLKVNAPSADEIAALREGDARLPDRPGGQCRPGGRARATADHRARDGRRAARVPCAVARRAELDGEHRRLSRRHRGGARVRAAVHRSGDRGGEGPPAKVLVAGAGVAGLAAIATASSLGAVVRATDPRPEVAEQVRSLGAEFLDVGVAQVASTDGYARETSRDYDRRAAEMYAEQAADVDIVITTALIPGRPAPGCSRPGTWRACARAASSSTWPPRRAGTSRAPVPGRRS